MKLETSRQGEVTVLRVSGELNAHSVGRFNNAVTESLANQRRDFLVDLSGVTTIDSAGLEALTGLQRQCEEQLGLLRVAGADATLRKIFEMTRLDKLLTLCESTEEALTAYGQA